MVLEVVRLRSGHQYGWDFLPHLQTAAFLLCSHVAEGERRERQSKGQREWARANRDLPSSGHWSHPEDPSLRTLSKLNHLPKTPSQTPSHWGSVLQEPLRGGVGGNSSLVPHLSLSRSWSSCVSQPEINPGFPLPTSTFWTLSLKAESLYETNSVMTFTCSIGYYLQQTPFKCRL